SQISFGDVTGDQQFTVFASSISQYRTLAASYVNLSRRFQYALQAYSQTLFFYGQLGGAYFDPAYAPFIDRNLAQATQSIHGGTALGIYPFDRYRRLQTSVGFLQLNESFSDPSVQAVADQYQLRTYGQT